MNIKDIYSNELDEHLKRFCADYAEAVTDLARCAEEDARAKHAYELTYAQSYLRADGTIPQREAQVTIACERQRLDSLIADSKREAARARIKYIDKELSILQTRAANKREEMALTRMPEPRY